MLAVDRSAHTHGLTMAAFTRVRVPFCLGPASGSSWWWGMKPSNNELFGGKFVIFLMRIMTPCAEREWRARNSGRI